MRRGSTPRQPARAQIASASVQIRFTSESVTSRGAITATAIGLADASTATGARVIRHIVIMVNDVVIFYLQPLVSWL
jgi:hypothetical protein